MNISLKEAVALRKKHEQAIQNAVNTAIREVKDAGLCLSAIELNVMPHQTVDGAKQIICTNVQLRIEI